MSMSRNSADFGHVFIGLFEMIVVFEFLSFAAGADGTSI